MRFVRGCGVYIFPMDVLTKGVPLIFSLGVYMRHCVLSQRGVELSRSNSLVFRAKRSFMGDLFHGPHWVDTTHGMARGIMILCWTGSDLRSMIYFEPTPTLPSIADLHGLGVYVLRDELCQPPDRGT